LFMVSCTGQAPIDYCKIYEEDQSHIFNPALSKEENQSNLQIRKEIFLKNFDVLMTETKKNGFPNVNQKNREHDECRYDAVLATLIHICQTRPDIFYSEMTRSIFIREIEKGNLSRDLLFTPIKIASHQKICEYLREDIETSITAWKLDSSLFENMEFVDCKKDLAP
jgi:hypothetical protein